MSVFYVFAQFPSRFLRDFVYLDYDLVFGNVPFYSESLTGKQTLQRVDT